MESFISLFFIFFALANLVSQDFDSHVFFANQTKFPIYLVPSYSGNTSSVEVRKLTFLQYEITHDHSSTISAGDLFGQPEKDHNEDNSSLKIKRRRDGGNNNFSARLEVRTASDLLFTILVEAQDLPGLPFVRVYYNVEYPDGSLDMPAPGVLMRDNEKTYSHIAKEIIYQGEVYRLVYGVFDENQDKTDNIIFSLSAEVDTIYRYEPPISDTLNPHVLNIYCYNPGILMPLDISDQDENERAIVFHKVVPKNMDILVFQEFFEPKKINKILEDLSPWYPYHTGKHNRILIPGIGKDGGVRIVSRYPILEEREISFSENGCIPDDFFSLFANKGVKYAKINKKGQMIHVFGTHTSLQPCDLYVMGKFIADMKLPKDEVVIMAGDFNVDMNRIKNGSDDYSIMLDTLNALEPTYLSFLNERSYTGTTSGLSHMYCCNPDGRQHLDYVLANAKHKVPYILTNRSQMGRLNEPDESFGIFDMGDHLPLYARMEFPSVKSDSINQTSCIGSTVTLVANVEVQAPGGWIKWYKDETEIEGESTSQLTVEITEPTNFGNYTFKYFYNYTPDTIVNNFFDSSYMDYEWYFRGVTTASIDLNFSINPMDSTESCAGTVTGIFNNFWNQLSVFPNPTDHFITISGENLSKFNSIEIVDVIGRRVNSNSAKFENGSLRFDVKHLSEGVYFLKGMYNNTIFSKSFVKMK